ncbi:hypothetical protein PR202_ga27907 [Eleusine coracana subsp. coracana]|uniref:Uncharacterized protein n=1 Tax=Eleusine coracana subsp. coracana TaxID=191504 RepID=A0AAV5DI52_ELECO|nr:hypothetical protein PR202_ga27907 [Eleusine coracana subsp. coracana]
MADGDSSDFTFCKISSTENDGKPSPDAIPVSSLTLEDGRGDNKYHAWVNAEFLLEKCLVGFLDPNE